MTAIFSIAALAVLFVVYALVRPRHDCGSDCGACAHPCHPGESHDARS
jgi:hypothetical protein